MMFKFKTLIFLDLLIEKYRRIRNSQIYDKISKIIKTRQSYNEFQNDLQRIYNKRDQEFVENRQSIGILCISNLFSL